MAGAGTVGRGRALGAPPLLSAGVGLDYLTGE
jgi:hypothetical protein